MGDGPYFTMTASLFSLTKIRPMFAFRPIYPVIKTKRSTFTRTRRVLKYWILNGKKSSHGRKRYKMIVAYIDHAHPYPRGLISCDN